ncbi:hypothetical protein FACS1894168_2570 [Deltaproteobacteria bacterium]|nr:hypothetical protein FACS1894168_2570 [Deltaproteobacteria bacterium]
MNMQPHNTQEILVALCKEAKRIEEDTTYSSKSHFNAAASWEFMNKCLGIPSVVLAALVGTTLIKNCPEIASVCALVASLLTALMTFLKPNDKAAMHRASGNQYLSLRNEIRYFRTIDLVNAKSTDDLVKILRSFGSRRDKLNQTCPSIPRRAFEMACKGIEEGEATYKVDDMS